MLCGALFRALIRAARSNRGRPEPVLAHRYLDEMIQVIRQLKTRQQTCENPKTVNQLAVNQLAVNQQSVVLLFASRKPAICCRKPAICCRKPAICCVIVFVFWIVKCCLFQAGIEPDSISYGTVVDCYLKTRDVQKADNLLTEMRDKGHNNNNKNNTTY